MASSSARTREALTALSRTGLSFEEYVDRAAAVLQRAVPFDALCMGTVDPDTTLLTRAHKVGIDVGDRTFLFWEYAQNDVAHFGELSTRAVGVSILEEETGGDKNVSGRFREVVTAEMGADHELRGVARAAQSMWGVYAIYRSGATGFNAAEAEFMHGLEATLASGVRNSVVVSRATASLGIAAGPAVLVFGASGEIASATATAAERLDDLGGAGPEAELPVAITAIVESVRSGRRLAAAHTRARGLSGHWYTLHAAPFLGVGAEHIAVTIEPSTPPQILPLLVAAYGLTAREASIVQAVLRGDSTNAIARALHLSPYTVQDHFKSIFAKLDVSSRREIATKVFYGQYLDAEPPIL